MSSYVAIALGTSGVVYPPAFLAALRAEGERFLEAAPRDNDIWVNAVAVRAGIRAWQIRATPTMFTQVPGTQHGTSLWRHNRDGGYDERIAATYGPADVARMRGRTRRGDDVPGGDTAGAPTERDVTDPSKVRVYGRLRTSMLERLHQMVPAQVLYTGTRYDFDLSRADPENPPGAAHVASGSSASSRGRHHAVVEINEPAMVDRWFSLLAEIVAVRARSLARRPRTITAYCMGNADPALRGHRPLAPAARASRGWRSGWCCRSSSGAPTVSRSRPATRSTRTASYVGASALESRARLFEILPAPARACRPRHPRRTNRGGCSSAGSSSARACSRRWTRGTCSVDTTPTRACV